MKNENEIAKLNETVIASGPGPDPGEAISPSRMQSTK